MRNIVFGALFLGVACLHTTGAEFQSDWPHRGERIWVGPGLWANRLQDWRVVDGRLECLESRAAKPMRTVHLLTHRPGGARHGDWTMRVEIGAIGDSSHSSQQTSAGFLIGAGGGELDPRAAALVHHSWGPGAGLFAGVDANGTAFFQDLETGLFRGAGDAGRSARGDSPKANWRIMHVDSVEKGSPASNAIDGDPNTIWHTEWQKRKPKHPHEIQIDLGRMTGFDTVMYTPRKSNVAGRIKKYELYVGNNPEAWGEPVSRGELRDGEIPQLLRFERVSARYLRLVALSAHEDRPSTTIAELDVLDLTASSGANDTPELEHGFGRKILFLSVNKTGARRMLTLTALDAATGERISQATLEDVLPNRTLGNLGLVSHPGTGSATARFWFKDWRVEGDGHCGDA